MRGKQQKESGAVIGDDRASAFKTSLLFLKVEFS